MKCAAQRRICCVEGCFFGASRAEPYDDIAASPRLIFGKPSASEIRPIRRKRVAGHWRFTGRLHAQRLKHGEHPIRLVGVAQHGQWIGETRIKRLVVAIRHATGTAHGKPPRSRARRIVAIRDNDPIKSRAPQRNVLNYMLDGCRKAHTPAVSHAAGDPTSVDAGVSIHYPRIVVGGKKMDLRLRQAGPQMREHGRGEQQIAQLVTLND